MATRSKQGETYSMTPGLPRMLPEICSDEATPHITGWLARMSERAAVQRLADFWPKRD